MARFVFMPALNLKIGVKPQVVNTAEFPNTSTQAIEVPGSSTLLHLGQVFDQNIKMQGIGG